MLSKGQILDMLRKIYGLHLKTVLNFENFLIYGTGCMFLLLYSPKVFYLKLSYSICIKLIVE